MSYLISYEKAPGLLSQRILSLSKGRILAAVDGMAASGKTTLGEALQARLPGSVLVHMDDFFLPPEKRILRESLRANADIGRFQDEVLLPLSRGDAACYRPFCCHPVPRFLDPVVIPKEARIVLVEGAYCLHPSLFPLYDLRVLVTVSPETQRARIFARNGEAMLPRFLSEWIPLENRHIAEQHLLERCDFHIAVP